MSWFTIFLLTIPCIFPTVRAVIKRLAFLAGSCGLALAVSKHEEIGWLWPAPIVVGVLVALLAERNWRGRSKKQEPPLKSLPSLKIFFDPKRHVVFPYGGKDYALIHVGICIDRKASTERASLQVAEIVAPRGKKRALSQTIARVAGKAVATDVHPMQMAKMTSREGALRAQQTTEFPVDAGAEHRVGLLECYANCFYFRTVGATFREDFPNGTYEVTLLAHGQGVEPCKRRFKLRKISGKARALLKPIQKGVPHG